ncbi:MAG: hypothetical protein ACRDH1_03660 [Actinomycetota bacterium]
MQAYRQERQDAVYPRIVVPNEVQEAIRSYMPYYGGKAEKTPQCKQLLVDQAGVVFVDYLRTTFHFPDAEMQVDSLRDHRSAVLSGLLDTRHDPRAQDKMYWSARYHNYFAQTHFPVVPELLIEERDPHLEFFSLADYWSDEP